MYQYHGWLSTLESADDKDIERKIKKINAPYPASAVYVNGELHISFSGSPNRDRGQTRNLVEYLVGLEIKLTGCVYINDPDLDKFDRFGVVKVVEDAVTEMHDRNFTIEETRKIFT